MRYSGRAAAIALAALTIFTAPRATAQNLQFGGAVLNQDIMMPGDFAKLSTYQPFGTARSMAMGNAYTSLGADLSSMSINPAGVGMFQHNYFSVTPGLAISNSSTAGTDPWKDDNSTTKFVLPNIGFVVGLHESSHGVMSVNFGFGINRLANFNNSYSYSTLSQYNESKPDQFMPTIADVFADQLQQGNVGLDKDGGLGYADPYYWPAALGFNGYMVSLVGDTWLPDTIGSNASLAHAMAVEQSGSINEYLFSVGMNYENIIYAGLSASFHSVYYNQQTLYQEEYLYDDGKAMNSAGNVLDSQLGYSSLWQQSILSGSGAGLKLGVTVRPTSNLRFGVAYHTPTVYNLSRVYQGDISSELLDNTSNDVEYNGDKTPYMIDEFSDSWRFRTPHKLLLGGSYTLGQRAILAVDYERTWYNSMKVKNVPTGNMVYSPKEYNDMIDDQFRATNTLRAGLEFKLHPMVALRAGGGYSDSMLTNEAAQYSAPTLSNSHYLTAGMGFTFGTTVLDVAYQYNKQNYSAYQLFFSQDEATGNFTTTSGNYCTSQVMHNIALTLGFRF